MAFIVPSSVADGQVLTDTKWNQDVVENTSLLYYTSRLYQSSQVATPMPALTTSFANLFSTGATFPAVSGSVYRILVNLPGVTVAANASGVQYIQTELALTGAVTANLTWGYFEVSSVATGVSASGAIDTEFWWVATATGNVTANLRVLKGNSALAYISEPATGNSVRLRVSGPMLAV